MTTNWLRCTWNAEYLHISWRALPALPHEPITPLRLTIKCSGSGTKAVWPRTTRRSPFDWFITMMYSSAVRRILEPRRSTISYGPRKAAIGPARDDRLPWRRSRTVHKWDTILGRYQHRA